MNKTTKNKHKKISTNKLRIACFLLLASILAAGLGSTAKPASAEIGSTSAALCDAAAFADFEGNWENITETRSIEAADIFSRCGDVILNGERIPSGSFVNLWGSCHPKNCDWGAEKMTEVQHGGETWYRATYSRSWATKYVWIKPYGEYLRVWIWRDYHDGRTDSASNDWLRKK